jgi:hypothetical protein
MIFFVKLHQILNTCLRDHLKQLAERKIIWAFIIILASP